MPQHTAERLRLSDESCIKWASPQALCWRALRALTTAKPTWDPQKNFQTGDGIPLRITHQRVKAENFSR